MQLPSFIGLGRSQAGLTQYALLSQDTETIDARQVFKGEGATSTDTKTSFLDPLPTPETHDQQHAE